MKVKKEYFTFDPKLIHEFAINGFDISKAKKISEEIINMSADEYTNATKSFYGFGYCYFLSKEYK